MKKILLIVTILASCSTLPEYEDCERTYHGHCVEPEDCPECRFA